MGHGEGEGVGQSPDRDERRSMMPQYIVGAGVPHCPRVPAEAVAAASKNQVEGKGKGMGQGRGQGTGKGSSAASSFASSAVSSAASSPALVATPGKRGSISPGRQTAVYKKLKVGTFFRQSTLGFPSAVEQGVARFEPPEERMAAETPEERMVRIRSAEIATYTEEQLAIDAAEHEHMGS